MSERLVYIAYVWLWVLAAVCLVAAYSFSGDCLKAKKATTYCWH